MKTRTDRVYKGTLTTSSVAVATVGADTTFLLQGIVVSNGNAADKKVELLIDDVRIVPYQKAIPTGDVLLLLGLSIPVLTGQAIEMKGEVDNDMDYYLWGVDEVEA